MSSPVPLPPEIVSLINTSAHPDLQALLGNGSRFTCPMCADGGRTQTIHCINFEDRGQAVHLLENTLKRLDPTNVSELGLVNEGAEEKYKRVLAEPGTQQEPESVTSRWTAKDLSEIHTVAYWCTVSNFQLVPAGHEKHLDRTRGDTRLVTGSIAHPNEHREQHHQARENEMQGTTEETKDSPERSGANINVGLVSKETHLSEPRKDSAIGAKVSRPDGLLT